MAERKPTPDEQVRSLYEENESKLASAAEELVGRNSFAELLSRLTENAMALTRIGNDVLDLGVRNLRLAGRQDVTRLARQLARTEDKLELVLQQVERLDGTLREMNDGARTQDRRSAGAGGAAAGARRDNSRGRNSGSGRSSARSGGRSSSKSS
jgi:hypothetical protein